MKEIIREVDALIAEMDSAGKFDDDIFISFFRKKRTHCLRKNGKTAQTGWEKLSAG